MRTLRTPAGIGDNVWLLMKLINAGEKFNFVLPGHKPRRGAQLFELLPQVGAATYGDNINYRVIDAMNAAQRGSWKAITGHSVFLSANRHLEHGNRIEAFLPDLKTSFSLPYIIPEEIAATTPDHEIMIGIYGSSYSTARSWGFWQEREWLELIKLIHQHNKKAVFCIIGAEFDTDMATALMKLLDKKKIPYENTIGRPLAYVVALMRKLRYAFYFPSGLAMLSETAGGSDSAMFYPKHLDKMIKSWAEPERMCAGAFYETLFCSPEEIHDYVKNIYKLYERI